MAWRGGFKTGLERGLICNQCIGTHPGCSIFNYNWHWGVECGRRFDKCVKLIERRGSDTLITRDCLSNLEAFRVDIPADKYEGCHAASSDPKLGVYVQNSIPELDIKRRYYSNVTWCFCSFDHWCNSSRPFSSSIVLILVALNSTLMT
ncbi:uncharacterized protein LOC111718406 [Eurytemora carolleeae]|uniref:uncharacterized protein LOC111718406 n=1 Tax=Eurytemora carolleeae TaxID=1294199 RepID=UPI000C772259|nr:uncharacterized protein LOC111718406 [Eurytemora carolleeae]|eukprot:XP_023349751.1 uncharacterized protein LOC111718406 [Eurytemora affinis]